MWKDSIKRQACAVCSWLFCREYNIKIRGPKIVAFSGLTYMVACCPKNLF